MPNRFGYVVASQFARVRPVEVVPKLLISAWPFWLCQKPMVAVRPWKMTSSPNW